ncbi:MAG: DnaB-like helicase C-terminal domain-containing protein [Vibrio splendidus]
MNSMNVPPHSIQAEQGVLGAILIDASCIEVAAHMIESKHFYAAMNADIYQSMRELYKSNKPIDFVTMTDLLEKRGQGDAVAVVADIMRNASSTASLKNHCEIIIDKWKGRQLIGAANVLAESIYNGDDYDEARHGAFKSLEALTAVGGEEVIHDGYDLASSFTDELERILHAGGMTGLTTGDEHIDYVTGGFQPGDYITMAARSGGGKTTRALNIMTHMIQNDKRCLMFSMEMKKQRVMMKMASDIASVEFDKLKTANMNDYEWAKISEAVKTVKDSKIHVDDSSGLSIGDIERKARRLKAKYGSLDLIVVDYIQRIKHDAANKYSELSDASNRLKDLFMELNCSGIVLAQLKKNSMGLPNASDLRETGSIENDSDVIIFLHTDSEDRKPKRGMLTCEIFNKVRYGETCVKMLTNELQFQRFKCTDEEYREPEEDKGFKSYKSK